MPQSVLMNSSHCVTVTSTHCYRRFTKNALCCVTTARQHPRPQLPRTQLVEHVARDQIHVAAMQYLHSFVGFLTHSLHRNFKLCARSFVAHAQPQAHPPWHFVMGGPALLAAVPSMRLCVSLKSSQRSANPCVVRVKKHPLPLLQILLLRRLPPRKPKPRSQLSQLQLRLQLHP